MFDPASTQPTSSIVGVQDRPLTVFGLLTDSYIYRVLLEGETHPRFDVGPTGVLLWGSGSAAQDTSLSRDAANRLSMANGDTFRVQGTWNGGHFEMGTFHIWVDATGDLRIKDGAPASDLDGTVVGAQT